MAELSLEVETAEDAPGLESLQRRLEHSFQTALNLRVPIRLVPPGSLPRFEMKAQALGQKDRVSPGYGLYRQLDSATLSAVHRDKLSDKVRDRAGGRWFAEGLRPNEA